MQQQSLKQDSMTTYLIFLKSRLWYMLLFCLPRVEHVIMQILVLLEDVCCQRQY